MLTGRRILVTGVTGQIAFPLATFLAERNEVWGLARFGDPEARRRVARAGIVTCPVDLADGDLAGVPRAFDYVVHLAAYQGAAPDYDRALRVNAEATGAVLAHARGARAALVMSTGSVYRPQPDPFHHYREGDPLGDAATAHAPTYAVSKIAQEATARWCARAFDLPVVIARMNAAYGDNGGLLAQHLEAILAGRAVTARSPAHPYTPIHQDDINHQLEAMLEAAACPATVVNWGGDEVVTVQQWCAHLGALTGRAAEVAVAAVPGSRPGNIADPAKRLGITGPCRVDWRAGLRRLVEARPTAPDPG